jgi:hypothetical protein
MLPATQNQQRLQRARSRNRHRWLHQGRFQSQGRRLHRIAIQLSDHQHGEFVTAQTSQSIAWAHDGRESSSRVFEEQVAGIVSLFVVHLLEAVHVHEQDRVVTPSLAIEFCNGVVEAFAIQHLRQGIRRQLPQQSSLLLGSSRNVTEDHERQVTVGPIELPNLFDVIIGRDPRRLNPNLRGTQFGQCHSVLGKCGWVQLHDPDPSGICSLDEPRRTKKHRRPRTFGLSPPSPGLFGTQVTGHEPP